MRRVAASLCIILLLSGCSKNLSKEEYDGKNVDVTWNHRGPYLDSGHNEDIQINIKDKSGNAIQNFDDIHNTEMLLTIVSEDLSYFNQVQPKYTGDGLFNISTLFPASGDYKLIAEFIPIDLGQEIASKWENIQGEDSPSKKVLHPDEKLLKEVDGLEVSLSLENLQMGAESTLKFTFNETEKNALIMNLQPYLGEEIHVVIISADAEQYMHYHSSSKEISDSEIKVGSYITKSEVYKIWGQFQREGTLYTVPFVIEVP